MKSITKTNRKGKGQRKIQKRKNKRRQKKLIEQKRKIERQRDEDDPDRSCLTKNDIRKFNKFLNLDRQANRIKKWYDKLNQKVIISKTLFENGSIFFQNCPAAESIYLLLSECGTTAGAICNPSGIDITEVEDFLKKDENDESESQKIRNSMIENCIKPKSNCSSCNFKAENVDMWSSITTTLGEIQPISQNCRDPNKIGSFAFCTKILKESYHIASACINNQTCPVTSTPTPTTVCGQSNLTVGSNDFLILERLRDSLSSAQCCLQSALAELGLSSGTGADGALPVGSSDPNNSQDGKGCQDLAAILENFNVSASACTDSLCDPIDESKAENIIAILQSICARNLNADLSSCEKESYGYVTIPDLDLIRIRSYFFWCRQWLLFIKRKIAIITHNHCMSAATSESSCQTTTTTTTTRTTTTPTTTKATYTSTTTPTTTTTTRTTTTPTTTKAMPILSNCYQAAERKNVNNLISSERQELNTALGMMKTYTDWTSFGKVANYHGAPYMCDREWVNVDPTGNGPFPCCDHGGRQRKLFEAWHRPYIKNFELALHNAGLDTSIGLPYWDWTEGNGNLALPQLATTETNWIDGDDHRGTTTVRNLQSLPVSNLRSSVRTALCQTNYRDFDNQISNVHGSVHVSVGGSMRNLGLAAYDPIFYLHHSNVDRYYAYWQALQTLRGLSSLTSQTETGGSSLVQDFLMPPFTNQVVNPFGMTRENPSQAYGLNYQQNYCYRYDNLIFDGLTPEQFYQSNMCGNRQRCSCLPKTTNQTTRNNVVCTLQTTNRNGDDVITIENAFFTIAKDWPYDDDVKSRRPLIIDVTDFIKNIERNTDSILIDFDVISYDENGTMIDNVYKPISECVTANGSKKIKLFVDNFSSYYNEIRFCNLEATVEFYNRDGNYNKEVVLESYGNVSSPFEIFRSSNNFIYNTTTINIGFDPSCHIRCDESRYPVEIDPCSGPGCVKVVRWDFKYILTIKNTFNAGNSTAIIAWCNGVDVSDIFEVETEADFNECKNIPKNPVTSASQGGPDGFLVKTGGQPRYFVSREYCNDGWKIMITSDTSSTTTPTPPTTTPTPTPTRMPRMRRMRMRMQ